MNADRIEWYANQLRGIPVADIPRKVRSILMDATNEARRAERERCAKVCDEQANEWDSDAVITFKNYAGHCAEAIRAME